jgi:cell division protein FtsN
MADRYQGRTFPANNDYDRGDDPHASAGDSDPLAELARLIGQTDPFGATGRPNQQVRRRTNAEPEAGTPPAGPPPWMARVNRPEVRQEFRHEAPPQEDAEPDDYPRSVHPLQRYAAARPAPERERNDHDTPPYADESDHDRSRYDRYDEALYDQLDVGEAHPRADQAYADDAYGYQDGYDEGVEEPPRRRGGMVTVAVVLALAVLGTGAALAYRTFVGSPRGGEPPIIRADTSPTKIMPAPADGTAKLPDRLVSGDSTERIVPREEAPVDINAKAGPRVVFPPLNQNGNPPSAASVAPTSGMTSAGGGTLPNSEPRKIRTLAVRGEQPDGAAMPTTSASQPPKPGPAVQAARPLAPPPVQRAPPTSANASAATPLALVPPDNPAPEPRTRVANTSPTQPAPAAAPAPAATGAYLVQVSSQRNEADAQASYRALQGKFPAVLGSHAPVIKRADLGDKGVYYRAMVGPFGTSEEASQLCGSLKSAGGQCVVQRN